ncbi:hypothetical protein [Amycolatopsis sp. NPDC001319]|uniref:hypothetical protein n=1 Tax=unclassified Amycolatopsis TaxID=2618356 RepID=UPI00367F50B3
MGFCRNNANGILLGCHLRQHKFEKLAVRQRAWSKAAAVVFKGVGGQAAAFSAFAGIVSAGAAAVTLAVKQPPPRRPEPW